jgi:hypothetical protein
MTNKKEARPLSFRQQVDACYKEYEAQLAKDATGPDSDQYLVGLELVSLTGRYEGVTAVRIPVNDFRERLPIRRIESRLAKACGIDLSIGNFLFETQMRGNRSFGGKFVVFQILYPE